MEESPLEFETLAAQAGLRVPIADTISTAPPIDASTTFTYDTVAQVHRALEPEAQGYAYSRNANPTVVALEQAMARLEGAEEVVAFGSGMAAVHAALFGVGSEAGDVIVAANDLYGVSRALLIQLAAFGIETRFVNVLDARAVEVALSDHDVRVLYVESMSNPLLRVPDLRHLTNIARSRRVVTVVDNTFVTPYLLRPLDLGVDLVVHSATKYIAGHGDATAGLVATSRSYGRRIRDTRTVTGGILSPFDGWLTLRGLRTLPIRMERHCASALQLARWLHQQDWVERVYYPGLTEHPQHALACEQFGGKCGGIVSFDLAAGREKALSFMDSLSIVTRGTSLGDVESLVLYPPLSSHRTLLPEELRAAGIGDGLVRLSVGLESVRDLARDLEQAAQRSGIAVHATGSRTLASG